MPLSEEIKKKETVYKTFITKNKINERFRVEEVEAQGITMLWLIEKYKKPIASSQGFLWGYSDDNSVLFNLKEDDPNYTTLSEIAIRLDINSLRAYALYDKGKHPHVYKSEVTFQDKLYGEVCLGQMANEAVDFTNMNLMFSFPFRIGVMLTRTFRYIKENQPHVSKTTIGQVLWDANIKEVEEKAG